MFDVYKTLLISTVVEYPNLTKSMPVYKTIQISTVVETPISIQPKST